MKEKQGTKILVEALLEFYNVTQKSKLPKAFDRSNISNWKTKDATISKLILKNVFGKVGEATTNNLVEPIAEFYKAEIINSKGKILHKSTIDKLKNSKGIYVFYNSQGKAIYVGKTKEQNLWKELGNAYNRRRSNQNISRVKHNKIVRVDAKPTETRQIVKHNVSLKEIASYFSAYKIDETFIDSMETTIIRMFPNDLLNTKIEKFKP
jgi:hypothetical protein